MLIGLGGGAASSMAQGASSAEDLDFASVQRGNAEIERRAQEVIDRCWAARRRNPILSIHDVGAGGLSNALPELVHDGGAAGVRPARDAERRARHVAARDLVQRGAGALRAGDRARDVARSTRSARASAARTRCSARRPPTTAPRRRRDRAASATRAGRRAARRAPRQAAAMTPRRRARSPRARPLDTRGIACARRRDRVLRCRPWRTRRSSITIGDRTVGGLCARDQMVGPWQVPVADVAVTARGLRQPRRRGDGDGRAHAARAARRRRRRRAWPSARRSPTSPRRRSGARRDVALGQLDGAGRAPGEDAALYDTVRRRSAWSCARRSASRSRSARTRCRCARRGATDGGDRASPAPVSLIVTAFAPVATTCAHDADAAAAPRDAGHGAAARRPRPRPQPARAEPRSRRCTAARRRAAGRRRPGAALRAFFDAIQALRARAALLAYHDRSDGGLFATLLRDGVRRRARGLDVDGSRGLGGEALPLLFRGARRGAAGARADASACARWRRTGSATRAGRSAASPTDDRIVHPRRRRAARRVARRAPATWSETTHRMQRLRDDPAAPTRSTRASRRRRPGLSRELAFDPATTSPRRSSRAACGRAWRSCASRASTARSRWRPRSTAPASTRDVHMTTCSRARRARDFRASSRAAASRTATCSAPARAGPSRSSSTTRCATSSRRSSRAATRSRSACATAAR
jgi:phosphoribosylformylglycinamidine synthase